jgi:putative peptide maturation dehydrogenase
MSKVRRSVYVFVHCHDGAFLDVELMLRGTVQLSPRRQLNAISVLRGEELPITREELELLFSIPSDLWVEADPGDGRLRQLARNGLLVSDEDEPELVELRRRDEVLSSSRWNLYGALYHFLTKWRDVDLRGDFADELDPGLDPEVSRELIEEFIATHGPPPPPFHRREGPLAVQELPLSTRQDGLFALLGERKTTRGFDRSSPLTLDELAVVLYYVFGYHGYTREPQDLVFMKRTSPSGGSLHPIEAYPLVTSVEGVEPGIHHYNGHDHTLELVCPLETVEAIELATRFVCGQSYFGCAHVSFLLTARFHRSFWKYRKHQKAYAAILMDAAHLSQTLYLVAAELGLGAYVTVAVNGHDIEERLGLDGVAEGAIAVCGCGRPAPAGWLEPDFVPFTPRETDLTAPPEA